MNQPVTETACTCIISQVETSKFTCMKTGETLLKVVMPSFFIIKSWCRLLYGCKLPLNLDTPQKHKSLYSYTYKYQFAVHALSFSM